MKKIEFLIRILNSELLHLSRKQLERAVRLLPDGVYSLQILPIKRRATAEQHGYLHAVVFKHIAAETGDHWLKEKMRMKAMFASETIELKGYRDESGTIVPSKIVHVAKSLADLSLGELVEFTDDVCRWAFDFLGVVIPEADPNWRHQIQKSEKDD